MRIKKELKLIQMAALVAVVVLYAGLRPLPFTGKAAVSVKNETGRVERVVDGDTLKLSDGRRVRLIGVDTPELHYSEKLLRDSKKTRKDIGVIQSMGRRAADFTKRLCEGRAVRIETDVTKTDRYGRTLAYLYLDDGTFINARIISEGYGQVMTIPPNVKHAEDFLKLRREAMEKRKGLWADTDTM